MIKQIKLNNNPVKAEESARGDQPLSEKELKRFLRHLITLQADLQHLPVLDDQFVEEVAATQSLLTRCRTLVESVIATQQRKLTRDQLSNWDNEGGKIEGIPHFS